jgi:hypothetical protein
MILFPLMTAWMGFIFSEHHRCLARPRHKSNAEISWLPVPFEGR